MALVDDVAVVGVGVIGLNGESADAVRMTAIEGAQDSITAALAALTTADITNIDETGATDGQTLVRSGDGYVLGSVSGAIATMQEWDADDGTSTEDFSNIETIRVQKGLVLVASADPRVVYIEPVYGGTGTANTVAHGDHQHVTPSKSYPTWTSKGTLSSGSVSLVSGNYTLLADRDYLVSATLRTCQRGNGGSSYYTLSITIDGNTRTSPEPLQTVGGVPDPRTFGHAVNVTGTGASVAVSATITYSSGDPLTVDAGELEVHLQSNR